MDSITNERWKEAQQKELSDHALVVSLDESKRFLNYYFDFFEDNISDIYGKSILEIGTGSYPLSAIAGASRVVGVEPLYDQFNDEIKKYWKDNNIIPYSQSFEEWESDDFFDEVWFINFLQHTMDPDKCLDKAKRCAKKIRVFEPINTPIDICHPHSLSVDLFVNHFPNAKINIYKGGTIGIFHMADCCYFVYEI